MATESETPKGTEQAAKQAEKAPQTEEEQGADAEVAEDVIPPLAHDAQGNPIYLPDGTAFWRVRRQTGRQGRPSNVYGLDGAPLIVSVFATADDLRENGCGPGTYRLEALDVRRRSLGIVAFTEITADADEPARPETGYRDALTDTIKAQAEIIKSQGEALRSVAESVAKVQGEIMHSLAGARSLPDPPLRSGAPVETVVVEAPPAPAGGGAWQAVIMQLGPLLPQVLSTLQLLAAGFAKSRGVPMQTPEEAAAAAAAAQQAAAGANGTAAGGAPANGAAPTGGGASR